MEKRRNAIIYVRDINRSSIGLMSVFFCATSNEVFTIYEYEYNRFRFLYIYRL